MKVALIAGCTGLIGKHLLDLLLDDPRYHQVKAITRRPLEISNPKLETIIADYHSLNDHATRLGADDVFCCLGTTIKVAKTKEAFEEVDFYYPLRLAKLSKAQGAKQYLLVSALGADVNSSIFYNQVKGKVEQAITDEKFSATHIFRPSLLLGDRKEERPGEEAAKFFYKYASFLIPKKYKGIDATKVARAMLHFSSTEKPGIHIHESAAMQSF